MEIFDIAASKSSLLKNLSDDTFASRLLYYNGTTLEDQVSGTYFGFVTEGEVSIEYLGLHYSVTAGMYFSLPKTLTMTGEGKAVISQRIDYEGFFQLGGPVEECGRLTYIDGCTDSLLISPVLMGDPCLNLLHIPPHTEQSQHTHPSLRLGVIISGEGTCVTPETTYPLVPGTVFYIPQDGRHSFHTKGQALRVIAYHPDSDFGPTHEDHPMVNKTIL